MEDRSEAPVDGVKTPGVEGSPYQHRVAGGQGGPPDKGGPRVAHPQPKGALLLGGPAGAQEVPGGRGQGQGSPGPWLPHTGGGGAGGGNCQAGVGCHFAEGGGC